mmetsp:Transcript_96034/g.256607  ORF Transcript_96034/g.256607 Transcript_96034/m.256607 type:complete len:85 (-) Transcript_96034:23-277(-)
MKATQTGRALSGKEDGVVELVKLRRMACAKFPVLSEIQLQCCGSLSPARERVGTCASCMVCVVAACLAPTGYICMSSCSKQVAA